MNKSQQESIVIGVKLWKEGLNLVLSYCWISQVCREREGCKPGGLRENYTGSDQNSSKMLMSQLHSFKIATLNSLLHLLSITCLQTIRGNQLLLNLQMVKGKWYITLSPGRKHPWRNACKSIKFPINWQLRIISDICWAKTLQQMFQKLFMEALECN